MNSANIEIAGRQAQTTNHHMLVGQTRSDGGQIGCLARLDIPEEPLLLATQSLGKLSYVF